MNKYNIKALVIIFTLTISNVCLADTQAAKNFHLNTADLPTQLSDLKGQVVYVDFWASWCKPCRHSFPWMNDMQQKYSAQGLQIITINLDNEQNLADEFLQKVPTQLPIVFDPEGKIASAYQIVGMPSSYLIDRSGNIRFSHTGFFTRKQKQYEQEITLLLAEKE